jgi:hypothetical protein
MRWMMVMVGLVALSGGACRKKPALVPTPISQLDPLGGTAPAPRNPADNDSPPAQQPVLQAAAAPDAGAANTVIVAPKTTTTPTVASPYIPGGGSEHLPLWKQRAKFY